MRRLAALARHAQQTLAGTAPRWPTQCAICHGWSDTALCSPCLGRFAVMRPRCLRCALPLDASAGSLCADCLREPPPFDASISALDYAPPWTDLIARFKFRGEAALAPVLAQRLQAAVQHTSKEPVARVLPVPIAADRLRERGYNQAWELARRVAGGLGLQADAHLLMRTAHIAHQVGMSRAQRLQNVRHAFVVDPFRRDAVRGQRVAVVDDVMTTGATAWELARTLKQAGASAVEIWALARTP